MNAKIEVGKKESVVISNQVFLEAIFGEQWQYAHVTGFPNDPYTTRDALNGFMNLEHGPLCWAGHRYESKKLNDDDNNFFAVSLFDLNKQGLAYRDESLFKGCYVIVANTNSAPDLLPEPSYRLDIGHGEEQLGWILSEPCTDFERASYITTAFDDGACEEGEDMTPLDYARLPEGVNTNWSGNIPGNANPKPSAKQRMLSWHPERKYTIEELEEGLEREYERDMGLEAPKAPLKLPKVKATHIPHGVRVSELAIKDSHTVLFDEQYLSTLSYHTVPTTRAHYFELYDELQAMPSPDERTDEQRARAKKLKSQLDDWKLECPYFLLRTFRVGEGRTDDAVVTSKGLTLDIDETEATSTQAALEHAHGVLTRILGDVPMVAYTSISHREHKPKLRFVIIYNGPISPGLQGDFDSWLYQECASKGLVLDGKMKTLSQPAFLPVQFEDDTTPPEIYVYEGTGERLNPAKFSQAIESAPKAPRELHKHRGGMLKALEDINSAIVKNHPIWGYVEDLGGSVGNGRTVLCPNHKEHTTEQNATGCIMGIYPDGGLAHSCMHAHCQDLTGPKVLDIIEKEKPGIKAAIADYMAEISAAGDLALAEALNELADEGEAKKPKLPVHEAVKKLASIKSEAQRAQSIKRYSETSGIPVRFLNKDVKKLQEQKAKQNEVAADEESIMKAFLSEMDGDFIQTEAGSWFWDGGVWARAHEKAVKQHLLAFLQKAGVKASARLIRSVESLLSWKAFSKRHTWNVGGTEVLNCKNGEVHLIDGQWELQNANREHYRTTQLPVEFDPKATAPRFTKFLDEIFEGDDDRQAKIQSLLELGGYSLMSHCRRERFIILVGGGRNGKSVFLEVLEALAGRENRAAVAPENFDNKFQVAYLEGKLINLVGEIREGAIIPDAELKAITSGEPRTAEFKGQNPFTFKPFSTCWFGTNHMPHTRDFSEAMFQRAMIFTFNNMFIHDEDRIAKDDRVYMADVSLKDGLMSELPGILNMMLSAYAGVVGRGFFTECASSIEAKKAWAIEADQAAQFFSDCCIEDITRWLPVASVFYAYSNWARANGIKKALTKRSLVSRLERLGYKKVRRRDKDTGSVCVGIGGLSFNDLTKQWHSEGGGCMDDDELDF